MFLSASFLARLPLKAVKNDPHLDRFIFQSDAFAQFEMKKQVLFIHSAVEGAFEADKKLAASLQQSLGPEYELQYPAMPDEENMRYEQWEHQIEKDLATMPEPIIFLRDISAPAAAARLGNGGLGRIVPALPRVLSRWLPRYNTFGWSTDRHRFGAPSSDLGYRNTNDALHASPLDPRDEA